MKRVWAVGVVIALAGVARGQTAVDDAAYRAAAEKLAAKSAASRPADEATELRRIIGQQRDEIAKLTSPRSNP
jgi:hypothetical protein